MGTHTFATLEISPAAWNEIHEKLEAAGYGHAFVDAETIDMHGIAVVLGGPAAQPRIGVFNDETLLSCLRANFESAFPGEPARDPQDMIQRLAAAAATGQRR